ncbi:hypothetical protein NVP1167O_56 [Vibrio phage 1.167.O._10N.261.51.F2]|nr:hypothetical protein NVP1167O_56 [Vibrio phage 1.167.O._10N.261.51.F2]
MSGKYNRSKRSGSQPVQTKRSSKNAHNHEKQCGYAIRMLERDKYFKELHQAGRNTRQHHDSRV